MAVKKDKRKMHVTVKQTALQRVLDRCVGATKSRGSLPLLGCFLLVVECSDLEVAATDLEITIQDRCSTVNVDSFGRIAIPAGRFHEIVKALPGGDVELEVLDDLHLSISHGDTRFNLACLDAAEFPDMPDHDQAELKLQIDSEILKSYISACFHAICNDQQKPHMCGLNLQACGENFVAAATDGHRLAIAGKKLDTDILPFTDGVTVPRKAIEEIKKLDGLIEIWQLDNSLCFAQDVTIISARLLEGKFPAYRNSIPQDLPNIAVVGQTVDLAEAVKRVAIVADHGVVTLDIGEDDIEIKTGSFRGEAVDLVPADVTGEATTLNFASRYLLDGISSIGTGEATIKYGGEKSPVILIPGDHAQWDERLNIIMPRG